MQVNYKFLFNFGVSYTGGGFKRLYEYAKWFNGQGGAWFIIHPNCIRLIKEFPNNHFFLANQPRYKRLFNDCGYLTSIEKEIGQPDLYYSYGIPVYYRLGRLNWFHLSNVLPLDSQGIALSLFDRYIKFKILGRRIKNNYENADVISAESKHSLDLIKVKEYEKLFLSVNGSNDELTYLQNKCVLEKDDIATVVGTHGYKALRDSYQVFEMLRQMNRQLKLILIGNKETIPKDLLDNRNIIATGVLKQCEVIDYLNRSKYYISTTRIENSFNAASEGVVFADESYISDIGPHRELLRNEVYDYVSIPNLNNTVLHVKRDNVSGVNLKSWDNVISDIINKVKEF